MRRALRVETMKLMRSTVTWTASLLMGILIPVLALAFTWVAEHGTGPVAAKAQAMVFGVGWTGYLNSASQIGAAATFVGAGVVVAWMFGREHTDRTFASLFALPVSKGSIAAAKLTVLAAWAVVLSTAVSAAALHLGVAAGLPPLTASAMRELGRLWMVVFSTCLLATTVALVASVGRGYLPPIGAVVLLVAAAQISVAFGAGGWFPYAVPGLSAVANTGQVLPPHLLQLALVPLTALVVAWLTIRWWNHAEVA